jgi:benzylsuccinate synthase
MPTTRIVEIEKNHFPKHFAGDQGYAKPVHISIERTRHFTESWKQTEGEPVVLRRAKAFAHHLDLMEISIRPNELIVGMYSKDPSCMQIGIETSETGWARDVVRDLGLPEEQKEWDELFAYWDKRNLAALIKPMVSEADWKLAHSGLRYVECLPTEMTSRTMPDHDMYLEQGFNKLLAGIKAKLAKRIQERDAATDGHKAQELSEKINDMTAQVIAVEAFLRWTNRYSKLAREMAANEKDPVRKQELNQIADICAYVPANPARTFQEAIQSHWFSFLAYHTIELLCHGVSMRLDYYFGPYYHQDVEVNKTTTRERAMEILENFLIHVDEMGRPLNLAFRKMMQGINIGVYTIGGTNPEDGSDSCNGLTLLVLDAIRDLKLNHPDFKFRWHPKVNQECWRKTVELVRDGYAQPSIKNDPVAVDILMSNYGFTIEEARSYAVVGCISPAPHLHWGRIRRDAYSIRPAKALEMALNNGWDPDQTGSKAIPGQLGPATGDPTKFKTYEEVLEAFRVQLLWMIQKGMLVKSLSEFAYNKLCKRPFVSTIFHRSQESERDVVDTFEKGMPWCNVPGIIEVVDSMISLKKLVFDDKKYSMEQLVKALHADWVGYENMRQDFINVPKFGNDNDYADNIAKRIYDMFAEECDKVTDENNTHPTPSGLVLTAVYLLAPLTGALPNGRKLGDMLSDGGINPAAGMDKNGPMAAILSAAKIDTRKWKANVFNQKFSPSSVAGESGLRKFQSYIETALIQGLEMIQFNIVDATTLKDAQKNPLKYPNLQVRVTGYNARFIDLHPIVQEHIIERSEHTL